MYIYTVVVQIQFYLKYSLKIIIHEFSMTFIHFLYVVIFFWGWCREPRKAEKSKQVLTL